MPDGCTVIGIVNRSEYRELCQNIKSIRAFDAEVITSLAEAMGSESDHGEVLTRLSNEITAAEDEDVQSLRSRIGPDLQLLTAIIEASTVYKDPDNGSIYFPYKWMTPFNVSYNRSLQNLSSYYTDIGIFWLICFIFSMFGIVYGLVRSKKHVLVSSSVTFVAWILRWFIGGGIIRYSIGLVIWSILSFIALIGSVYDHKSDAERPIQTIVSAIFVATLMAVIGIQMVLNMVRIASQ